MTHVFGLLPDRAQCFKQKPHQYRQSQSLSQSMVEKFEYDVGRSETSLQLICFFFSELEEEKINHLTGQEWASLLPYYQGLYSLDRLYPMGVWPRSFLQNIKLLRYNMTDFERACNLEFLKFLRMKLNSPLLHFDMLGRKIMLMIYHNRAITQDKVPIPSVIALDEESEEASA
jgi:hypothetical protein